MIIIQLPDEFEWDFHLTYEDSEVKTLMHASWPRYMIEVSEKSDQEEVTEDTEEEMPWEEYVLRFPIWGIRSKKDQKLLAYANAVFMAAELDFDNLPQRGWEFAMDSYYTDTHPNCMCLLSASIDSNERNRKLSAYLIEQAKEIAQGQGVSDMIAPVRPTHKFKYPNEGFKDYVIRTREDGSPYDPWIRTHLKSGGRIVNICTESFLKEATLKEWADWTGLTFQHSGKYPIPQGLDFLEINMEADRGIYKEPNLWIHYKLSRER